MNKKIESGEVKVSIYQEPQAAEKAKITATLLKLGYPEWFLKDQPWPFKENWAQAQIPYEPTREQPSHHDGGGVTASLLDNTWLDYWRVWGMSYDGGNTVKMLVEGDWNWKQMPTFLMTDKIGFVWTGDGPNKWLFDILNHIYYFYGCTDYQVCQTLQVNSQVTIDVLLDTGVGTPFDVLWDFTSWDSTRGEYTNFYTKDMYGSARLWVQTGKTGQSNNKLFSATAAYFHQQASCNASLQYDSAKTSVGLSGACALNYDQSSQPIVTISYKN